MAGLTLDQKMSQMVREIWQDGYDHGEAAAMAVRYTMEEMADRVEAADNEGYERGRAESQKLVADAAFGHGLRVGASGATELRWMYEQSVEATLDRVCEIVASIRHEDACCSRGCACRSYERPEPCDLLCNCMVGSVVSEILYAVRRAYSTAVEVDDRRAVPEPPAPNAQPAFVNRWSGRDAARGES